MMSRKLASILLLAMGVATAAGKKAAVGKKAFRSGVKVERGIVADMAAHWDEVAGIVKKGACAQC